MILSKFSLINFRQFKNVELEFSQDPDKPFTIITGGNTYGKQHLLKRFYGVFMATKISTIKYY